MKVCALCSTECPDDAATCPTDGEASWLEPAPATTRGAGGAGDTAPPVAAEPAEPAPKAKRR